MISNLVGAVTRDAANRPDGIADRCGRSLAAGGIVGMLLVGACGASAEPLEPIAGARSTGRGDLPGQRRRSIPGAADRANEGWSWSLDPEDFEFADLTTEVCDGEPADVEDGDMTSDRYCPWSAVIVTIEPAG